MGIAHCQMQTSTAREEASRQPSLSQCLAAEAGTCMVAPQGQDELDDEQIERRVRHARQASQDQAAAAAVAAAGAADPPLLTSVKPAH